MAKKKKPENTPKARRLPPPPPEHTRWKKGQSGNPGGRPKTVVEFRAACQEKWEDVLKTWLEILKDKKKDPHARNRAGELLAAYAFGKPAQGIQVQDADGAVTTLVEVMKRAVGGV